MTTAVIKLNDAGLEFFGHAVAFDEEGLVKLKELRQAFPNDEFFLDDYDVVYVKVDEDGEEDVVIGEVEITTEELELDLEDFDEDGHLTVRPFTITVTYSGDHHDQDWDRLYEWVRDEWAGSDAVYKFHFPLD